MFLFVIKRYVYTSFNNEQKTSEDRTAQKMKFSIKDFFSKYDKIRDFLRIKSHLLKKSLMENFIFCAVSQVKLVLYPGFSNTLSETL